METSPDVSIHANSNDPEDCVAQLAPLLAQAIAERDDSSDFCFYARLHLSGLTNGAPQEPAAETRGELEHRVG